MQPTLVPEPFHRDGWVYEEKCDGWRMLAYKDGQNVRLVSWRGREHTERFVGLAAAVAALPAHTLILDGEVCVVDDDLVSQFHLLGEQHDDVLATPPMYMAFDLLYLEGLDLRARPLADRRWRLEQALDGAKLVLPAPPAARAWARGLGRRQAARLRGAGGEGRAVAVSAQPARSWLKVKVRYEGVFTVGGLLGAPEAVEGVLVGERVGYPPGLPRRRAVGDGRAAVAELLERCPVRPTVPFQDPPRARWIRGILCRYRCRSSEAETFRLCDGPYF